MATQTEQIALSKQREQVPAVWQLELQTWTDSALLSLHEEEKAESAVRSYALWELEYRIAFDKKPLPVKELTKADRHRWTMADAEATIRRLMAASR